MPERLRVDVIRVCEEHGYFEGSDCPACGDDGREVLGDGRRTRLSKFVSGALRHFPDDAGLSVDDGGWTEYEELVEAVTDRYSWADSEHVEAVTATDPKGRFERRGDRIRAAYGHSIDVTLESTESAVLERLYHGTAPRNVGTILEEGLKPMSRQRVHLSETVEEAREVGRRHADDPVLLVVDAEAMTREGFEVNRRGTGTYTVARVPPEFLERMDGDAEETEDGACRTNSGAEETGSEE
ncbi:RNA 2'-phosphotransferase [Halogeometricum sp. S1BR25-6]|uniref:Probable RNA 2'-phosphotransferase n=1 Tax=Halogeometricum salsisoli TaxID=2950536 RepID=A0ABU2GJ53_9EURY|nr:RNA 2'-phosphotransferase [Halogeometricum sp. S1BR25-6]MDS0300873.1 RNA 2'-phosphotransferase [Halogeometricum sp. S1BR25-6]